MSAWPAEAAAVSQRISRRRNPRQRIAIRNRGPIRLAYFRPGKPWDLGKLQVWDHSRSGVVRDLKTSDERKNLIFRSPETILIRSQLALCRRTAKWSVRVLLGPNIDASRNDAKAKTPGQTGDRPEGDGYQHVGRPTWARNVKCILSPVALMTD